MLLIIYQNMFHVIISKGGFMETIKFGKFIANLRNEKHLTQEELAVATIVAVENFPEMVFQIMMEKYLSIINKEKKDGSN